MKEKELQLFQTFSYVILQVFHFLSKRLTWQIGDNKRNRKEALLVGGKALQLHLKRSHETNLLPIHTSNAVLTPELLNVFPVKLTLSEHAYHLTF